MLKIVPEWFDKWFKRNFPDKPIYSVADVQHALGWDSSDKVYRAIRCGDLIAFRIGKRGYAISRDALKEWLIDCMVLNQDL